MIYTVTCNPAVDYALYLDRLREGAVNRAQAEMLQPGGKGVNVSSVLKELGVESTATGFLAGPTGEALERALQAAGLCTDFVHLKRGMTRINVKLKGHTETEINGCGPQVEREDLTLLQQKLGRLGRGDVAVLAGSVPRGAPPTLYGDMMAALAPTGAVFVVDATGALLQNALPHRPFLVKPNILELAELLGRGMRDRAAVERGARELQKQGARNVLVSLGAEGALLLDETGAIHCAAAPRGEVRDSVGAGDSMVAGFLAGWMRSGRYAHALRLGIAAGSATAFSERLATREEIQRIWDTL